MMQHYFVCYDINDFLVIYNFEYFSLFFTKLKLFKAAMKFMQI